MSKVAEIVLASTSPYRRQLLSRLQIPFVCTAPQVTETPLSGEPPAARTLRLAEEKARAVAGEHPQALIIGGDQTVYGGGQIFHKPGNAGNAVAQLRAMRGQDLCFVTAVAVLDSRYNRMQSRLLSHRARFRQLTDDEITRYVEKEPAFNCAGGAQVEGLGISLLDSMEGGDPTAIIGLPLITLTTMLRGAGMAIP